MQHQAEFAVGTCYAINYAFVPVAFVFISPVYSGCSRVLVGDVNVVMPISEWFDIPIL